LKKRENGFGRRLSLVRQKNMARRAELEELRSRYRLRRNICVAKRIQLGCLAMQPGRS
jgi:hypothetical protein